MSYASEAEKAAWERYVAVASLPENRRDNEWEQHRRASYEEYAREKWKRETPHKLTFEFEDAADLRRFVAYMADGGGEYAFMDSNRESDKFGYSFLYHHPETGLAERVVKVIRLDRED